MRELPKSGVLQITVEAARYDDGLQPHTLAPESEKRLSLDITAGKEAAVEISTAGVYQLDVVLDGPPRNDVMIADIGKRTFSKRLKGPYATKSDGKVSIPLLVARFPIGTFDLKVSNGKGENLRLALMTPVAKESESSQQFAAFEKRAPHLSIHKGLRTDVGARLSLFAKPKPVPSATVERYSFRAPRQWLRFTGHRGRQRQLPRRTARDRDPQRADRWASDSTRARKRDRVRRSLLRNLAAKSPPRNLHRLAAQKRPTSLCP